jgi:glycosyltransferase involved in cell wall biosynthesis
MLTRFLDWYFTTDDPSVTALRTFVRENAGLRLTARAGLRFVRYSIAFAWRCVWYAWLAVIHPRGAWIMLWNALKPSFNKQTRAIARARALGGAISAQELADLWVAAASCRSAFCIVSEPEFRQVEILIRSRNPHVYIAWFDPLTKELKRPPCYRETFDLAVVAEGYEPDSRFAEALSSGTVIRTRYSTSLSEWGYQTDVGIDARNQTSRAPANDRLARKLERGESINVVCISDIGFQYGAGTGLRRQTSSFLLNNWKVRVAAWTPGNSTQQPTVTGFGTFDNWQGVVSLSDLARAKRREDPIDVISREVSGWNPDVVITGNLHGTEWPLKLLARLRASDRLLVAYMHDAYWVTGRCAYPGTCTMFETGCTSACPTPHEYPQLSPKRIPGAWAQRDQLFRGQEGISLVANSRWTQGIARRRFGEAVFCDVVPLALDHHLFSPIEKATARRLLGLPQEKTLVAMGAVDLNDQRKGGPLFRGLHQTLLNRDDVGVLLFGASSHEFEGEKCFGLIDDERLLPLLYSAADIYIGTAVEEAFGQTLLEASACGLPVVAFNVGGVSDVVVHEETGLLIDHLAVEPMLAATDHLILESAKREAIGRNGRRRVENNFTLKHQAHAWKACISGLSESRAFNR